jgi:Zn-dependent M28 family amino/carboxypeptidase
MKTKARRVWSGLLFTLLLAGSAAGDQIGDIINQATLGEYQSYLRVLTGVDPVPGDTPAWILNRYAMGPFVHLAGQYIRDEFQSFGLNTAVQPFLLPSSPPVYGQNVIAELPGTTRPQDIYVIGAHYDGVWPSYDQWNPDPWRMPGCDDNASGTGAVLMAARILAQHQFAGTIRFIAFSGEEEWMIGSDAYVQAAHAAGENIVAAINLDMILHPGFDNADPDPDYDLDIEGDNSSQGLAHYMASQYAAYTSLATQVHNDPTQVSDHAAFWWYGYQAVGLSENIADEIWGGSNDTYHMHTDTIYNPDFDWDFGLQSVRGSMAGLMGLAGLTPEPGSLVALTMLMLMATRRTRRGPRAGAWGHLGSG